MPNMIERVAHLDDIMILPPQLTAALEDREWAPSAPEAASEGGIPVSEPISSQSLRRSRVSGRANLADRQSPGLAPDTPNSSGAHSDRNAPNETFFESLGAVSLHIKRTTPLVSQQTRTSNDRLPIMLFYTR